MPSEEGGGVRACPTGLRRPGDTDGLIRLLAADVVAYADGGGKTQTFLRPMYGRRRIARLLLRFGTWLELLGVEGMRLAEVNGQPGAVFLGHDGRLILVVSLDIAEGLVQTHPRHQQSGQAASPRREGRSPLAA
jgi:hypothetical protein